MTLPAAREQIAALPAYVPGARGGDGPPPIKLSSNESPYDPLPSVVVALTKAGDALNRYPDMYATALTERLAAVHDAAPGAVVVGQGSVSVLAHILQAYSGAGTEVIFAWRSFEAYPILTAVAGATSVRVPLLPDSRHDLDAMAAAITDRTRVIMLCTPNNPTGPALRADEVEAFLARVPENVVVVLDEAYVEYVTDADAVSGAALIAAYPNVIQLRTFSKAYGLAGARVGYAVGAPEVMAPVRACLTPFSVTEAAQLAALASLDASAELHARVSATIAERARVLSAVRGMGYDVPDAQGNFLWLPLGARAADLVAHLGAQPRPILVRPFMGEGVRVTVGADEENDAFLAALGQFPPA